VGLALIARGCDVLVETPVYDPLLGIARALGANVVRFERRFEDQFAIDPAVVRRGLTPATRLVMLTQPHNPSSGLTPDDAIAEIASDAAQYGAHVLVDEVYLDAARGCGARPAALLAPNIISTNSLTKSYGLAPLRCGWAIASPETAERIRRARDIVDGTGSIPAERMSVVAFGQLERLARRADGLVGANVTQFRTWLERTQELEGFVQRGTVAFPRLRSGLDARTLADRLMQEYRTAVVPGGFFEAPAHIRIGLGIDPDVLRRGLDTIGRALRA
jgi:aspartate/methionine/tyrosine aminotransferase